jgi:hypothetical protein
VAGLPAKQIELAREVVPGAARIGILDNLSAPQWQELETAGRELGVNVVAEDVRAPHDLDGTFQAGAVDLCRMRANIGTNLVCHGCGAIQRPTGLGASSLPSFPGRPARIISRCTSS